jgi:hypothetical protein
MYVKNKHTKEGVLLYLEFLCASFTNFRPFLANADKTRIPQIVFYYGVYSHYVRVLTRYFQLKYFASPSKETFEIPCLPLLVQILLVFYKKENAGLALYSE